MSHRPYTPTAARPPRVEYRHSPSLTQADARRRRRLALSWLLGLEPWPEEPGAPKP